MTDWESAKRSDTARFGKFFHFMLERGVYLAPSQFEAGFVSAAHSEDDIRHTVEVAREFFDATAGLCETCAFCRLIRSDRGSVFYQCQRSFTDSSFPKYPPLPVLECRGYASDSENL